MCTLSCIPMKNLPTLAICAAAILTGASALQAQIVTRSFDVVGSAEVNGAFHPSTRVDVSADIGLNTYTINFSNTLVGPGGYVGTITSFGFNTPFSPAQLGVNGSNVTFASTKPLQPTEQHGWGLFVPYDFSQAGGVFAQEVGAGTGAQPEGGNPGFGIHFGETASFVFTLPDFTSADGFFDSVTDFTVRWQQVGLSTVREGQRNGSDFGGANDGPSDGPVPGSPVPEPSTYALMGAAVLLGLAAKRRFFGKSA
jgi:hypothetical protein